MRVVPDRAKRALDPHDVLRRRIDKKVDVVRGAREPMQIHRDATEDFIVDALPVERLHDRENLVKVDHYFNSTPSSSYGALTESKPKTVGYTSPIYGARSVASFRL